MGSPRRIPGFPSPHSSHAGEAPPRNSGVSPISAMPGDGFGVPSPRIGGAPSRPCRWGSSGGTEAPPTPLNTPPKSWEERPQIGAKPKFHFGVRMMRGLRTPQSCSFGCLSLGLNPLILGLNPPVLGLEPGWGWHSAPSSVGGGFWGLSPSVSARGVSHEAPDGGGWDTAQAGQAGGGGRNFEAKAQKTTIFTFSRSSSGGGGPCKAGGGGTAALGCRRGVGGKAGEGAGPKRGRRNRVKEQEKREKEKCLFLESLTLCWHFRGWALRRFPHPPFPKTGETPKPRGYFGGNPHP